MKRSLIVKKQSPERKEIETLFLLKPEIIDKKIKQERRRLGKHTRRLEKAFHEKK